MSCTKKRYPTEREARMALLDAIIRFNRGQCHRKETRVYLCHPCHGWHLTSQTYDANKRNLNRKAPQ